MPADTCPICKSMMERASQPTGDASFYSCPRCGEFGLTGTADTLVGIWIDGKPEKEAIFSHFLRRRQLAEKFPMVTAEVAKKVIDEGTLPSPSAQADNLLRWLGDNSPGPGESTQVEEVSHGAIVGTKSEAGFLFILEGLEASGLVVAHISMGGPSEVTLTFSGWARYEKLKHGSPSGRVAFMAMKFGDSLLDSVVSKHFAPAVGATGFLLKRLDDEPKAGLIDDRLRVEIQACRFLLADLTHANNGAYWEAGYAEGLGKPVIYTCQASEFQKASHFDTNHHLTVLWEENDLGTAAEKLKNTIRATIPEASRS